VDSPWIEGIPPRAERVAPRIDVLTPTYWHPVEATILSPQLWVRWKHFDTQTKRPYPCPAPGSCPACMAALIKYPTGFLACCRRGSYCPVILQLSDLALADLETYCAKAVLTRGLRLKTIRQDARRNAKMHAEILGRDERDSLPAPFDVRPTLERMWGMDEARYLQPQTLGGPQQAQKVRPARRGR
jgi:hypothetical protein